MEFRGYKEELTGRIVTLELAAETAQDEIMLSDIVGVLSGESGYLLVQCGDKQPLRYTYEGIEDDEEEPEG